MNDGVKILLERIKTHPEEFTDDENPFTYEGKWMRIFDKYKHNLSKEDVDTFLEAFNNLRQEKFTAEVMAELLNPKQEEQLTLNPYQTANLGSVTLGAGATLGASLTNSGAGVGGNWGTSPYANSATITQQPLVNKKPTTLFGKLFNYL